MEPKDSESISLSSQKIDADASLKSSIGALSTASSSVSSEMNSCFYREEYPKKTLTNSQSSIFMGSEYPFDIERELLFSTGSKNFQFVHSIFDRPLLSRDRSEIDTIYTYLSIFDGFQSISNTAQLVVCQGSEYKKISESNKKIISMNDSLESWFLLTKGTVEITNQDNEISCAKPGDCFGFDLSNPTVSTMSNATYRAISHDVEFVTITREIYNQILNPSVSTYEGSIPEEEDVDVVRKMTGNYISSATTDQLIESLFDHQYLSLEPTYVEDFILTMKLIINDTQEIVQKFSDFIINNTLFDRSINFLRIWIKYYYYNFMNEYMSDFLEEIVRNLRKNNQNKVVDSLISLIVTYTPAMSISYESSLDNGSGIELVYRQKTLESQFMVFIKNVIRDSNGEKAGLITGDQIVCVNDTPISCLNERIVGSFFKNSSAFCFAIKRCKITYLFSLPDFTSLPIPMESPKDALSMTSEDSSTSGSSNSKWKIKNVLNRIPSRRESSVNFQSEETCVSGQTPRLSERHAHSEINVMDISDQRVMRKLSESALRYPFINIPITENLYILKIYDSENTFRFLPVRVNTTADIVISDYLEMIQSTEKKSTLDKSKKNPKNKNLNMNFLFEACPTPNGIITKRLPSSSFDIFNRASWGSRYYIACSSALLNLNLSIQDEIKNESICTFLDIDPNCIARILTLQDFGMMTRIQVDEYISYLKRPKDESGFPNLFNFQNRCNTEMNWVVTEILSEDNKERRVKTIKRFIDVASLCLQYRNFNSFFFIISGLQNSLVTRLKSTWDSVSSKYVKGLKILEEYLNPNRNMQNYRSWLLRITSNVSNGILGRIPLFPIILKDIFVINDQNETQISEMMNFNKLRMIAKELKQILYFKNPEFDVSNILSHLENQKLDSVLSRKCSNFFLPVGPDGMHPLSELLPDGLIFNEIPSNFNPFVQPNSRKKNYANQRTNIQKIYEYQMSNRKVLKYIEKTFSKKPSDEYLRMKSFEFDPETSDPISLNIGKITNSENSNDSSPAGSYAHVMIQAEKSKSPRSSKI